MHKRSKSERALPIQRPAAVTRSSFHLTRRDVEIPVLGGTLSESALCNGLMWMEVAAGLVSLHGIPVVVVEAALS
jgi:hypothetical protein